MEQFGAWSGTESVEACAESAFELTGSTGRPPEVQGRQKFKDGMGEGYDWVECGSFDTGWQVPYYAEIVG